MQYKFDKLYINSNELYDVVPDKVDYKYYPDLY